MEAMLRVASYVDSEGRNRAVLLPDDSPDSDAPLGLPLGPPDLSTLGLPLEMETRLHNELFARRVFTAADAKRRRPDVASAVQAALRIDAGRVVDVYLASEGAYVDNQNGSQPAESARPRRKK